MEIRIGFDAWGSIARTHAVGLRALPVLFPDLPFRPVLHAVATRNPAKNEAWVRQAGFGGVVGSALDLVNDPAVDAIDICTPNALHTETAIAAWRAGKAIYCEKPLAEDLAGAMRMAEAYRAAAGAPGAGVPTGASDPVAAGGNRAAASQVAFTLRFWPAVARAKDMLADGRLGRILSFRGRMVHGGYLDPNRAYSWRLDRALAGGGALVDLGIHLVDLVHFLLGPMADLEARMRTFVPERPAPDRPGGRARVEVDDWAELTCTLKSGAVGTIEATRGGDGQEETVLEIFGSEGSLRISSNVGNIFPQWFERPTGTMHERNGEKPGPYLRALLTVLPPARLTMGSFVDAHTASLHWWLRRIAEPAWAEGQPPLAATIADGLAAQEVLEAAYAAAKWG
ncbi:MAG TPA: Gfo/Idh/MocA family oxidoreductase [Symbiobacteriaceae bacterium]|nr:Gfo/Idh/MocA family oxidoreductase [Symbiobacteriaceae bacterium]